MAASTLFFRKKLQLLSVSHGFSAQLIVVDVEESVHELNAPHFPNIKLLVFLENRKVSDAFPECRPKSQLEWGAAKGCICLR